MKLQRFIIAIAALFLLGCDRFKMFDPSLKINGSTSTARVILLDQVSPAADNRRVNAIRVNGVVTPLNQGANRSVAFSNSGGLVSAFDETGTLLWEKNLGASGQISGGFDFDGDGVTDFYLSKQMVSGHICPEANLNVDNSWIEVYSGATGPIGKGDPVTTLTLFTQ